MQRLCVRHQVQSNVSVTAQGSNFGVHHVRSSLASYVSRSSVILQQRVTSNIAMSQITACRASWHQTIDGETPAFVTSYQDLVHKALSKNGLSTTSSWRVGRCQEIFMHHRQCNRARKFGFTFLVGGTFSTAPSGRQAAGHPFVEVDVALAAAGAKFIGDTLGSNREVSIVVCGLATGVYQSLERSMLDEQTSAHQNVPPSHTIPRHDDCHCD